MHPSHLCVFVGKHTTIQMLIKLASFSINTAEDCIASYLVLLLHVNNEVDSLLNVIIPHDQCIPVCSHQRWYV